MTKSSTSSEVTLLAERLRVMTMARLAAVVVLLVALAPIFRFAEHGMDVLLVASVAYLAINGLVLLLLRSGRGQQVILSASLAVDATWATVVMHATGQMSSPFIFLMYLQLTAATVLFSWRTGVKLAFLHTIGLVALFYGQVVGFAAEGTQGRATFGFVNLHVDPALVDLAQIVRVQSVLTVLTVWLMAGSTALFSHVNERQLRRSNQELAVLRELNTQLERSLEIPDICDAIAQGSVRELGYSRAVVWMVDGASDLVPAGAAGFALDELDRVGQLRLAVGPGPIGRTVETRRPVLVGRDHARPAPLADAFSIDSPLVVVPLQSEGRILGLVTVEVQDRIGRGPRVKGRELRILTNLATEASLALDNARLHAELRDLSITDALTGVYNHRHFQQRLQEELDRSARAGNLSERRPVTLLMMDVDLFKKINDRYGHPAGDDLLRALSRLMLRVLRSADVVCRYGGEEFAVILPETDVEQGLQVAERLREAIERSAFNSTDGRYLGQVTASFGLATFAGGVASRSEIIRRADEALYRAKRSGRNAVGHADLHGVRPGAFTAAGEWAPADATGAPDLDLDEEPSATRAGA